jgi:hypothetical protein
MKTQTTRRALLGDAGLASVAIIPPAIGVAVAASPAATEWTKAVAAWNAAHAEVARLNAVPGGASDEAMDAAVDQEGAAVRHLAALPAPDRAAVGVKINALLDYLEGCEIDIPTLRKIAADALRGEA